MRCGARVVKVLQGVQTYYSHRGGTNGWNISKMCGAYLMSVNQIVQHGCGNRSDSCYSELMYQDSIGKQAQDTKRRTSTVVEELAQRSYEIFTIGKADEANVGEVMSLPQSNDCQREPAAGSVLHPTGFWSYCNQENPICCNVVQFEGSYTLEVSTVSGLQSSRSGDRSSHTFEILWEYCGRNIFRSTLERKKLFFSISVHANKSGKWAWARLVHRV